MFYCRVRVDCDASVKVQRHRDSQSDQLSGLRVKVIGLRSRGTQSVVTPYSLWTQACDLSNRLEQLLTMRVWLKTNDEQQANRV